VISEIGNLNTRAFALKQLRGDAPASRFQPKYTAVAEVAIRKAIYKAETGNSVEIGLDGRHAHGAYVLVEAERGDSDANSIARKRADEGAAERDRMKRSATAQQTIIFVEDEFKSGDIRAGAGVGKKGSRKRLPVWSEGENNLHARATVSKWPLLARHQHNSQISSTTL
jgi:hypothetical protein